MVDLACADRPLLPFGRVTALALTALVALSACGQRELILPGEREAIRAVDADLDGSEVPPLSVPAARLNTEWTHLNGGPEHVSEPVVLGNAPSRVWSANLGAGSGKRTRVITAPIVAAGRIFAIDAGTTVTAVSTSGQQLWTRNIVPEGEGSAEGTGGGLAFGDGALIVASGFGEVLRLDPATGEVQWRTELEGVVRAAPAIGDGKAVVVARGDLGYGVDLDTGQIDWRLEGVGVGAGVLGGGSPAVRGPVAILPFVTGEVRAVLVRNGLTVWTASVAGGRREFARSIISDITGDPVIDFDIVYVANQAGRVVALDRRNGERIWTQQEGSYAPAVPVGGSVFMVSDIAEVLRVNADDGQVLWRQPLPEWRRPDKRKVAIPYYGPLLAGGRLVVLSGDGTLHSFDPQSGAPLGEVDLGASVSAQPAIAGGVLYVVSSDGRLTAFQ